MELRHCQVGSWFVNAYALICPDTRQSVLIDPGAQPDALEKMLEGTFPQGILITHSHPDHIGALKTIKKRLKVPVMAHPGIDGTNRLVNADRWLHHGDILSAGPHLLKIYHTPGHAQDHICIAADHHRTLLVGDTIFQGGPGKTWSAHDFKKILTTIRNSVLRWPDEAVCYPGHGPHFCLKDKRAAIEAFIRKDHGNFFGNATWEMPLQ